MQPTPSIQISARPTDLPAHAPTQTSSAPPTPAQKRKHNSHHSPSTNSSQLKSVSENGASPKKVRKSKSNKPAQLNSANKSASASASALGPPHAPFPTPLTPEIDIQPKPEQPSPDNLLTSLDPPAPIPRLDPTAHLQVIVAEANLLAQELADTQAAVDDAAEKAEIDRQVAEQFLDAERDKNDELSAKVDELEAKVAGGEAKVAAAREEEKVKVGELEDELRAVKGGMEAAKEAKIKFAEGLSKLLAEHGFAL